MMVATILFVVSFAASGTSLVIRPEELPELESGSSYQFFTPDVQEDANNEVKVYFNKYSQAAASNEEGGVSLDGEEQRKLDHEVDSEKEHLESHQNERKATEKDKDDKASAESSDDGSKSERVEEKSNEDDDGDVKGAKIVQENNADEESEDHSNLEDEEKESEELNEVEGDEDNDKSNYGDHEDFKWPSDKWFEEFNQDKGYNDFNDDHEYGKFEEYGDFGTFGKYSSDIRKNSQFGCLELGHGEYC